MTVRFDTRAEAAAQKRLCAFAAPDGWLIHHYSGDSLSLTFEPKDDRQHTVRVVWLRQADGTYAQQVTLMIWPVELRDALANGPRVYVVPPTVELSRLLLEDIDESWAVETQSKAVA